MGVCMNKLLGINSLWQFQSAKPFMYYLFTMTITSINIRNTMFVPTKMYVQEDVTNVGI
jgi:hypothetical protein